MTPLFRSTKTPATSNGNSFTRSLRFELADDEGRALLASHAISGMIGVAFVLLVHLGPRLPEPIAEAFKDPPIILKPIFDPQTPKETEASSTVRKDGPSVRGKPQSNAGDIGNAFTRSGGGGIVSDIGNILRSVAVGGGSHGSAVGGKTVLAAGGGGVGSTVPGGGGLGGGKGGGGEIGNAGTGGNLGRATVSVEAPLSVPVDDLAPATRNGGDLRTFVRSREAQLRVCYERGLAVNSRLAGSITVAAEIAADGTVGTPRVSRRSWSGGGVAEAEACILNMVRSWRLPASTGGAATYSFPFSFTR
jgi:hypothetical protein